MEIEGVGNCWERPASFLVVGKNSGECQFIFFLKIVPEVRF